jgi:glutaredoxin
VSGVGKLILYKSATCTRCPIAKFILQRVLTAKGLEYADCVVERETDKDSEAMAELLMFDTINTPVLVAGETVLREEEALNEKQVREAVEKWATNGV